VRSRIADERLVAASLDGDEEAFAALVSRHSGRARAVALALLRRPEEADDVVQEAVLAAFLGLDGLRERSRFGGWLCGIVANLAKMRLRRERAARSLGDVSGGAVVPEGVELSQDGSGVVAALEALPAAEREAVVLHYVEGLSCHEIAGRVGRTPGAVRVRLHRARRRLREHLGVLNPVGSKEERSMVEVEIADVVVKVVEAKPDEGTRLADERLRVVLLKEKRGERRLPIWIGASEGDALALQLGGDAMPRPITVDLTARLVEALGGSIDEVTISTLREKTFYAVVRVRAGDRAEELDARPSDALNLAARVGASIYVADEVMEQSSLLPDRLEEQLATQSWGDREPPEGVWQTLSPQLVKSLYPAP
jgi:RNA polymerase sigma factor (sigma-70 family)